MTGILLRGAPPLFFLLLMASAAGASKADRAAQQAVDAQHFFDAGAFEQSVASWRNARDFQRRSGSREGLIDADLGLAGAYHALGQVKLALGALNEALDVAKKSND